MFIMRLQYLKVLRDCNNLFATHIYYTISLEIASSLLDSFKLQKLKSYWVRKYFG